MKALIVDDHPHLVENLATTVPWREMGFTQVHTAYSGLEAMETIRRTPVQVLVTDIRMPGLNGLELIERARRLQPEIGCILLTGYADFDYARKAIELQAFRYLMKPVVHEELIETVRSLTFDKLPLAGPEMGLPDENRAEESAHLEPERRINHSKLLDAVHRYIQENMGRDVTLAAIARFVYLHPVYLSKLYKEATGMNLSEYILSARMERAKELLRSSPLKIFEVCQAVGYRSTQHFISEFRKAVGVTPKQFKDG